MSYQLNNTNIPCHPEYHKKDNRQPHAASVKMLAEHTDYFAIKGEQKKATLYQVLPDVIDKISQKTHNTLAPQPVR